MLQAREVLLAKIESTYNTDSVPTGASNAVLVENLTWGWDSVSMIKRPAVRASLGKLQDIYGGALKIVSFDVQNKASGTAGTAPEFAVFFKAAGLAETIVGATSCTYAFSSTVADHKSLSIYHYQDGAVHKITGAIVVSISMDNSAGQTSKFSIVCVGHDQGRTDASLASPTYQTTKPVPFIGASVQVHSYSAIIQKLMFDFGIEIAKPPSVNGADGFGQLMVTGRDPKGSFDTLDVLVATHDYLGRFKSGSTGTIVTGTIGATAGNRWALTLNEVYYREPSPGSLDGLTTLSVPFSVTDETTANNEMSLVYT